MIFARRKKRGPRIDLLNKKTGKVLLRNGKCIRIVSVRMVGEPSAHSRASHGQRFIQTQKKATIRCGSCGGFNISPNNIIEGAHKGMRYVCRDCNNMAHLTGFYWSFAR